MLDVRLPMGVMFVILGGILVVAGLVASPASYQRSLGINVDLWWGLVMAGLGVAMLLLVWRARRGEARRRP
jgi:hypothetical protein